MESGAGDNRILLFSSGLDSLIAWFYLGKPKTLHITGHSRYSDGELLAVKELDYKIPGLDPEVIYGFNWLCYFEELDANIPLRNAHFILVAAHYGDIIYLPCQRGEQSIPDRSPRFFEEFSKIVSYLAEKQVEISPVFPTITKQDMVEWYVNSSHPVEYLYMTYSCLMPGLGRCGECKMCFRTAIALEFNHILPDNFFKKDIWAWDGIPEYAKKMRAGHYEKRRTEQTLQVLKSKGVL